MYLYGAGGHAKVISEILEAQGMDVDGFIDDNAALTEFMGHRVRHSAQDIKTVLVSIGNNKVREKVAAALARQGVTFGMAVHPDAVISPTAGLGEGTAIMAGVVVNSCARVGRHCILNTGCSVDHDCRIDDFVHISPHATLCGAVMVGEGSWIGAGSVVIPGIRIGRHCVVGAGSVVVRDIPDGAVAYGNPARVRKHDMGKMV